LIDALAYVYFADAGASSDGYDRLPLPERFAALLAVSGGKALHHLDPVLNSFLPHFKKQPHLPSAQIPALFDLISHSGLLNIVESLIGSEVTASPIYHINFKLAQKHLDLVQRVVEEMGDDASRFKPNGVTNTASTDPALERFYGFQVGKTDWHMDVISGLYDSHESKIVNAWVPVTEATEENGCLLVIPGSHKEGVRGGPFADEETGRAIALPASPGDVVVLDNSVLHSATVNTSEDGFRWAFNFRYHPTGQPSGRPFLPGFVARSRSAPVTELSNPYLWSAMWDKALDHLSTNGSPFDYTDLRSGNLDLDFAKNLTERWNVLAPHPENWLSL
jgi:phytanoyl-CoA hydroxylase